MSVTITLHEDLAHKLARQAAGHRVSLQDWAVGILEGAADGGIDAATQWARLNARRLALISKEYVSGLTQAEEEELRALQDVAAKACEPQDRMLLEKLDTYQLLTQERNCHTSE